MGALDLILEWAWIMLAVTVGVLVLATMAVVGGPVVGALERRFGGIFDRRVRTVAGRPLEAPRWVCGGWQSVNGAAVEACHHGGTPRPAEGGRLRDQDRDHLYAAPPPANRFDATRYRGPGAPPHVPRQGRIR